MTRAAAAGSITETINLRTNTATGGSSVDVPTWAAGCIIKAILGVASVGTSNYFAWNVSSPVTGVGTNYLFQSTENAVTGAPVNAGWGIQVIVPFYDEPTFTMSYATDGSGTALWSANLLGFIRNV